MNAPPLGRFTVALAAIVSFAAAAHAAPVDVATDAFDGDHARLEARLWIHPGAANGAWRVGVELIPAPGWHVYWRNPGDTGLAPKLAWELEAGRVSATEWPVPRAFFDAEAELLTYGYEGPVLLASDARATAGHVAALRVRVDAVVCAELCIPGSFELATTLDPSRAADPGSVGRFEDARRRVPLASTARGVDVELSSPFASGAEGDEIRATLAVYPCGRSEGDAACDVGVASGSAPAFFPHAIEGLELKASPARPHPEHRGAFEIEIRGHVWQETASAAGLAGIVPLRTSGGEDRSVVVAPRAAAAQPAAAAGVSWIHAALFGLLGGLILNLMPCVLPVLAIKLFALAELGQRSRREEFHHAAAYVGGIELSMLALAATVLGLRAAGTAVGWGFQLQEPVFLAAIAALLVAFALNLFGVFEIQVDTGSLAGLGDDAPSTTRSFFDGLLAVALATPCSAPFLGTAVGFAFASSAPAIVSVFLAIGLGLAAPFLVAAAIPGVGRRIPRSGAWMTDLRVGLGFALLLTVVWLLWVLGRAVDSGAVSGVLALLVAVSAALWTFGRLQRAGRPLPIAALALGLGALVAAGTGVVDLEPSDPTSETHFGRDFERSAVAASLAAGRPTFVYFTADWCVTCKVNERGVLANTRVRDEIDRLGVEVFRADWTRRDDSIQNALAVLGKAGVPVYAVYDPEHPARPALLPEVLTVERLLRALRDAAESRRASS